MSLIKISDPKAYKLLKERLELDEPNDGVFEIYDKVYDNLKHYDNLFVYQPNINTIPDSKLCYDFYYTTETSTNKLIEFKIKYFELNMIQHIGINPELDGVSINHICIGDTTKRPNELFLAPFFRKEKINSILKEI